jgi:urease accessory protein
VSQLRWLLLCCGLVTPELALAHSFIPGAGSFVNGFAHPYVTPQHVIAIAMLGMFVGQHGADGIRWAVPPFGLALMLGLSITMFWLWAPLQFVIPGFCILLGLAVAIARRLPLLWMSVLVFCVGLMLGMDSPQQQLSGRELFMAFFGTVVGAFFGLIYVSALTDVLTKSWMKLGVRILGSWGAATALMVLAFIAAYRG